MKERLEQFKAWSKKAGKELYAFFSSKIFLKNFGGIVGVIALCFFLTTWWISCYTKHGESLQVNDFVGMDLDDAISKASSNNFQIVINDSTFIPGQPPNVILIQSPKPNAQVKKNRKIYVSVTKKIAELIELPNLSGGNDDFGNFSKKCARKYVVAEKMKSVFSNKLEPNTIIEVYYKGEDITRAINDSYSVPKGDTIKCVVTERGGGTVPIPELVCKKYDAASFLVGTFNLNIGSVISDNTVTDESSAYVWRQVPRFTPTSKARVGEQIDIYLTQFKPQSCSSQGFNIEAPEEEEESEDFDNQ